MTKIHIPLPNRVKSIKNINSNASQSQYREEDEDVLKIKFNKTPGSSDLARQNQELRKRVDMLEHSLQQAREETFLSGIEEGKEQLRNEMENRLVKELDSLQNILENVSQNLTKELKKLQPELLTLAKEIAKRIISNELDNETKYNEILLNQIGRILHELMDQESITIHVSPRQMKWIIKRDFENEFNLPGKIKIKFYEDRSLLPGECILESSNLMVEGKFQTQLDNLETQLKNL